MKTDNPKEKLNIVGPICETGDFLAKDINIVASQNDLLAVKTVGAYGFVMSSNYNSRPRAAEILVDKDKHALIRKREDYAELIALEDKEDD
jgi:diaminopimelate decarboxylase